MVSGMKADPPRQDNSVQNDIPMLPLTLPLKATQFLLTSTKT